MATPSQVSCMCLLRSLTSAYWITCTSWQMKTLTRDCMVALICAAVPAVTTADESAWKPLLDRDLSQFDIYLSYPGTVISDVVANKVSLKPIGLNPPGQDVFTIIQQDGVPVLRISGEIYGCAATHESFGNFHLRAEVK